MMPAIGLEEAIEAFLEGMDAGGRAAKTLRWYSDILHRFADRGGELTRSSVVRYLAQRRREVSPASHAGEHRALRRWCNWLLEKQLIAENPMVLVDRPKPVDTVPRVATANIVLSLVAAANDSKYPARDRALILTLADTGARLSEFLQITMDNLQIVHSDGVDYGQAWIVGKGARRRRLLIGPDATTELTCWIAERPPEAEKTIWWSDRGNPLSESGVRLILKRLSDRAGLDEHINPHAFRHGCAVDFLEHGGDIRNLQLILGHTQLTTTARYLQLVDRQIREAHDRVSAARFAHLPKRLERG
jgi:integrase/recombinase XerC/integrase/recombinase XerD